ncbi:MAG: peroxide stress protein YaaA [Bacillota bacterium]|nr:peroxide stress protein YaaA [Bacillota bacterium]
MRIIISPAKTMNLDTDSLDYNQLPKFIKDTEVLLDYLKKLNYKELKKIWKCSDKLADLNYQRIKNMNLYKGLTPAILSFDGLQYKYMGSAVFSTKEFEYLEEHLRILSGFYGIIRPFDGVVPYRLEMQSKLNGEKLDSLYEFWDDKLANQLFSETGIILNLASKEYSDIIFKHLSEDIRFITCVFGELIDGKVKEKGTLAKMARGDMVRFMAENQIEDIENIKTYNRLGYKFFDKLSDKNNYIFIKKEN